MVRLEHRIPPPVVGLAVIVLMLFGRRLVPTASFALPWRWLWVALTALCAVTIAATAIRSFKRAETTVNPLEPDEAETLVTQGIFRYSRNPMYVGLTLVLLAVALGLNNWVSIMLVALFPIYITRFQIVPEERVLSNKFGEDYEAYKRAVRRWL